MDLAAQIEGLLHQRWAYVFVGLFCAFTVAELALKSGREAKDPGLSRIATNFALQITQSLVMMAMPLGLAGIVLLSARSGTGLLSGQALPAWSVLVLLLLARTLVSYWVHRLEHSWQLLWRYHRVHHSDPEVDLTTALRQHPLALCAALFTQGGTLFLLGPPLWAFLLSDVLILANQFWQHTDVERRPAYAHAVGLVLVTPEIHRVHHSATRSQTDSNFGVVFSIWDRLFGTYTRPEAAGGFRIGLGAAEDASAGNLLKQLWVPFSRQAGRLPETREPEPATR